MSQFDPDSYFASRDAAAAKMQRVMTARERVKQELLNYRAVAAADVAASEAAKAARAASWSGQLGLEQNSTADNLVNLAASLASGASRTVGQIASLPVTATAVATTASLPQFYFDAYNRMRSGTATPEDMHFLMKRTPQGDTPLERINLGQDRHAAAREVTKTFDISSVVDETGARKGLRDQIGERFSENWADTVGGLRQMGLAPGKLNPRTGENAWEGAKDFVSGIAGLVYNGGKAILQNPQATLEYITENAPQLLVGMAGRAGSAALLASNAGYAAEHYEKGLKAYSDANGGQIAPESVRAELAMKAASLALAEHGSDLIGLGMMKAAAKGTQEAARTGFKQSLLNIGKATAGGVASEAPTEAFQTAMEGEIVGKPASAREIYEAAVIGGAAGGGLVGGVRTVAEATKTTPEHVQERARDAAAKVAGAAAQDLAISTGDVTALADPKSPTYAPGKAVAALLGHAQGNTSDDASRAADLAKADEIVNGLRARQADLKSQLATPDEKRADIADLQSRMAGADAATQQILQEAIAIREAELATPLAPKMAKSLAAQLETIDRDLAEAEKTHAALAQFVGSKASVSALVAQLNGAPNASLANAPGTQPGTSSAVGGVDPGASLVDPGRHLGQPGNTVPGGVDAAGQANAAGSTGTGTGGTAALTTAAAANSRAEAASKLVALAMATPDALDDATLTSLIEDETNALTPAQRTYLRAFNAARVAANMAQSLDGVRAEVFAGSTKNVGIDQYRMRMSNAVASQNRREADRVLAGLSKFEADHAAKAERAREALELKPGTQILRTADGQWVINTGKPLSDSELRKGGHLAVRSEKLVAGIEAEADALAKSLAELQAAHALSFGAATPSSTTGTPKEPSNVKDAPQQGAQGAQPQSTPARSAEDAAAADRSAASGTGRRGGEAAAAPASVEPARVEEQTIPAWATEEISEGTSGPSTTRTEVKDEKQAPPSPTQEPTEPATPAQPAPVQVTEDQLADAVEDATPVEELEGAEVAPEQQPVDTAAFAGVLGAIAEKSPEGTPYKARNLIGDFFTQVNQRVGDATSRPLVAVKDFLTALTEDMARAFTGAAEFTTAQGNQIADFEQTAKDWASTIRSNLVRRKGKNAELFFFNDMMQYFIQDTPDGPDLEENVKTAISYAAYSWTVENVARQQFNTDEEINEILGRDERHAVSDDERAVLKYAGARRNVVVNTLGQRVFDALGMKALKTAPVNLKPALIAAFGAHAFKLLVDHGVIERKQISDQTMQSLMGNAVNPDSKVVHEFAAVAKEADGKVAIVADRIYQNSRGAQGILDKMFSVEPGLKEPSFEPIPFSQKTTKNTRQPIPAKLAEIVAREQSTPWFVRQDMWDLVQAIPEDLLLEIAGAEHIENRHVEAVKSIEAANDGLQRELERMKDFVQVMAKQGKLEDGIYLEHSVWKQQRVGVATNVLNPQSSKLHRHMLFRQKWETTISRDDVSAMDNFRLRVAEGFGVKTDKQSNELSLAKAIEKMELPEIKAAVAVLVKRMQGSDLTAEDHAALLAGVKTGGEKMHSLDSLMAMAHMEFAFANGQTAFRTHLMGEVDGVTNGPMLSHLEFGAAANEAVLEERLQKGGFYTQNAGATQYNVWRGQPGHLDLYESTTRNVLRKVQELMMKGGKDGINPGLLAAVYSFTGALENKDTGNIEKAGRNIIKTPLTALVFGSSTFKSIDSMAGNFITSIYEHIEKAAAGDPKAMSRKDLVNNINTLLLMGKGPAIADDTSVKELMENSFSEAQQAAIKRAFHYSLGKAVKQTLEKDFGDFIQKRNTLNRAAQVAFEIYNAAFTSMRERAIEEQMDAFAADETKGIPWSWHTDPATKEKYRRPVRDLTIEEEASIRVELSKVTPVVHTRMSKESGSLRGGLFVAKTGRKLSQRPTFSQEVKFGEGFADTGAKSMLVHGFEQHESAPGVAMAPMLIHSLDSGISHFAAAEGEVLNVHDAHGAGVGTFEQTARNLNHATWEATLGYSPAREMAETLFRTLRGFVDLAAQGKLSPDAVERLKEALKELDSESSPDSLLQDAVHGANNLAHYSDLTKLGVMSRLTSIDQYALEGGNYVVTDADRAQAAAQRAALSPELGERDATALEKLSEILTKGLPKEQAQEAKQSTQEAFQDPVEELDVVEESPTVAPSQPMWGPLGEPRVPADPDLTKFLAAGPITIGSALEHLRARLVAQPAGRRRDYNLQLLTQLMRTADKTKPVHYLRADTPDFPGALALLDAAGWYGVRDGAVYMLSSDFRDSHVHPETLLHEIAHASLVDIVAEAQMGNANRSVKPLVADLESLLEQAKTFAAANKLSGQFREALSNVHEFIAYGLTNVNFQRKVLAQMEVKPKTNRLVLVKAMSEFIRTVTEILFHGSSKTAKEQARSGLAVFMADTAGLMEQVARNRDAQNGQMRTKGGKPKVLAMVTPDPMAQANAYSTLDIHEALGQSSPAVKSEFATHLASVLTSIVEKLHGPFGTLKASLMQDQAITPTDVWLKTLATGKAPFASRILGAGFRMSDQEAFAIEQIEATTRAAIDGQEASTTTAYRELERIYWEMSKRLKPQDLHQGDWATATPVERDQAQQLFDFVFKPEQGTDGRSDHLARFAALGLGHQDFNRLLSVPTEAPVRSARTFAERLQRWFEKALELFVDKVTHTFHGQQANQKLRSLVEQLVDIEAKRRAVLAQKQAGLMAQVGSSLGVAEELVKKGADILRVKATAVLESPALRNHSNALVRAAGGLARTVAGERVERFMDNLIGLRDRQFKGRQGAVAGLINNLRGLPEHASELLRMSVQDQNLRQDAITSTTASVLESFANKGKDLTPEAKAAISAVFMRTGAHNLLDHRSVAEIGQMVANDAVLNSEIARFEAQLTGPYRQYYIGQARMLGYFRATGVVAGSMLMMNAHNIARMYGTPHEAKVTATEAAAAEALIAPLVAMYGIQYSSNAQRNAADQVMRTEANRTGAEAGHNGVEFVLRMHKQLEKESLDRLFNGNPALMMHGYTPETYNPHVEVEVADATVGAELVKQGYVRGQRVPTDPADPRAEVKYLYVLRDGGLMPYQTGAVSLTGTETKGSKLHSGYLDTRHHVGALNASTNATLLNQRQGMVSDLVRAGASFDPTKVKQRFMAPVLNPHGEIVNWRYMMEDSVKNNVLERENRFEHLVGSLAGSVIDKQTTRETNREVLTALRQQFDAEFARQPERYVEISARSLDPQLREIWRLLPDDTRRDAQQIWGGKAMWVRADLLDAMFGYRKVSLADAFAKDPAARNAFENMVVEMMERVFGKKTAMRIRKGERMWQELVKETKDILVVKSGITLVGNIWSNFSLLWIQGVPIKDMIHHHLVAMKAATSYQRDSMELGRLIARRDTGYFDTPGRVTTERVELDREIARLENSIARNPVRGLIDAGLMPSIVEDVANNDDPYSYKSLLARKTKKYTDRLNPTVDGALRTVYMTHDTALYQGLWRMTQLSDFVARYTLVQHLTSRKENPLSWKDSVQKAADSFINYDLPLPRTVQWMDDSGLIMFTKYFLRIQRVLHETAKEQPLRTFMLALLHGGIGLGPIVLQSFWLNAANRTWLRAGALEYPGAFDELGTVNSALSLVK